MSRMNQFGIRAVFFAGCATLAFSAPVLAQGVEQPGAYITRPQHRMRDSDPRAAEPAPSAQAPAPASTPAPATPPANITSSAVPPSLLDKPAEPATIDLASGSLTIHADNSSLTEILNRVKADSGMSVDGLNADQRIFGSYGPGDPQDVLYALLHGSGYNVVMLGRTETGTPKELALTPRSAGANSGSHHQQQDQVVQDDDNDDESQQVQPMEPGAPQPPPPETTPQNGVRTPQQMLQELQQMRQQQQQQFQQQQQQPGPPQQQ